MRTFGRIIVEVGVTLALFWALAWYFGIPVQTRAEQAYQHFFPCSVPIRYSIKEVDPRFGISQADFTKALKTAEAIWEKPLGKNLFEYDPSGSLEVRLQYDSRQATTQKLSAVDRELKGDKALLEQKQEKYDVLYDAYSAAKVAFAAKQDAYEAKADEYQKQVEYWNRRGGAPKSDFEILARQKTALDQDRAALAQMQTSINAQVDAINVMVVDIKRLASEFNQDAGKYNAIGASQDKEFDAGLYESDLKGVRITIYQYDNYEKLVRVLAHEFGHALGLEHLNDSKAIMYYLNQATAEKASEADVLALKTLCRTN